MKEVKARTKVSVQKVINVISVTTVLFLFGYIFIFKNDKIAYVDSAKILSEYKGAIKARKEYDAKIKAWQSNVDTLTYEVQSSLKKHEKDIATMSAKEKQLSRQLFESKQKQLAEYQNAIQQNAQQEESKLYQQVISEVNAFLLKYGKNHNYKMILIASQSGTIAYAREGLDITANVIEELNKDI